jgi:hypothetical protein
LEAQLTPEMGWTAPTAAVWFQGWSVGPVRMINPACADEATELPTATQEPMAGHETSVSAAAAPTTDCSAHRAPPLSVVRMTPRPALAPFNVVAVVPTTVQRTPATPTRAAVAAVAVVDGEFVDGVPDVAGVPAGRVVDGGGGRAPLPLAAPDRQSTPLRYPVPAGVVSVVHVDPPSVVRATIPATWSTSIEVWAVTQQWWPSEQETAVAPATLGGREPAWVHPVLGDAETRATAPPATVPMATH